MSRVRVKICGFTTVAEAVHAVDAGADAIGLNFYPRSVRYVTPSQAEAILRELPPFAVTVGLMVDESAEEAQQLANRLGLAAVQTYRPDLVGAIRRPLTHIPAFRLGSAEQLQQLQDQLHHWQTQGLLPDALLVDSFVPGELGGTGHRAPWELLAAFRCPVPLILAGGLTPDNVADAVRLVRPWGVDVASGVESAPGRKDPGKIRAFLQAVQHA